MLRVNLKFYREHAVLLVLEVVKNVEWAFFNVWLLLRKFYGIVLRQNSEFMSAVDMHIKRQ